MMRFKEWIEKRLKLEVSTSTANVASFPRRVGEITRRNFGHKKTKEEEKDVKNKNAK